MNQTPDNDAKSKKIGFCGVLVIVVVLLGLALLFFSSSAPIVITLLLSLPLMFVLQYDREPFEASRVLLSLIVAWFVDKVLFWLIADSLAFAIKPLSSGIIVASLFAGYLTWRSLLPYATSGGRKGNPLSIGGGLALAIFLMVTLIGPIIGHFFPAYWHFVTTPDDSGS